MPSNGYMLANAPCSWGTIEHAEGGRVPYDQMLDELAQSGYVGTELGDWGYMPTDPDSLDRELRSRGLSLVASWVSVRLFDEADHGPGRERALRVARLMARVGGPHCIVNLGDDHSSAPDRQRKSGRIGPEDGLDAEGWESYVRGAEEIARAVREETGLRTCLHPHGATYVETAGEVEEFLSRSDPELVGIVLDTGHYRLGGGDPVELLRRHHRRVPLVHFKDFDPAVLKRAEREGLDYYQMVGEGIFPELGRGDVDFPAVLRALDEVGYQGWIVVEQDVLPGMGEPARSARRNREYLKSLGL